MKTNVFSSPSVVPGIIERIQTVASQFRSRQITPAAPPFTHTDTERREIEVRRYQQSDFDDLVTMYDTFASDQRTQGTPPLKTDDIRAWLSDILDGVNAVAICENQLIGHVSFVPDEAGRHELAIFVHQNYQQAGIGSRLLAGGLGLAKQQGVDYVWLSVEKSKRYQQRFYNCAGFTTDGPMGIAYRMSRTL
jgi:ribosomal protein S18 acetylase RimI-like enzyme